MEGGNKIINLHIMSYKRNGDHYFHQIDELPKNLKKVEIKSNKFVFGEGEASNHLHTLTMPKFTDYQVYEDDKGNRYFEIKVEGELGHFVGESGKTADHKKTKIQPGVYIQVPEREVDIFSGIERKTID